MKQFRLRCSLLLAFFVVGGAGAGVRPPHLEPVGSILSSREYRVEYELAVRKVLFPEGVPETGFGAVVLPSFFSEWALFLASGESGDMSVELRVVDGQVWGAMQNDEPLPVAVRFRRGIEPRTAAAVSSVLQRALRETAYPMSDGGLIPDGTGFHFFSHIPTAGLWAGETHSPDSETRAGNLVFLLRTLHSFVKPPAGLTTEETIRKAALEVPAVGQQ